MRLLLLLLSVLSVLMSCTSDSNPFGKMNDFDQGPMLENLGNNLIVPAYAELSSTAESLKISAQTYTSAPSVESLGTLRSSLKSVRLAWQYCSPYQFGPAESQGLAGLVNIYPVDTFQIKSNIENGDYNLNTLSNADARGFQALGFLLYKPNLSDSEIVASLSADEASYINEIADLIAQVSASVHNAWSADGGNYLGTFTSPDSYGVNVGSSVGKLINAMNLDYERNTRDGKIGIPVGIRSLGDPILHASEAYYAGYSLELFKESIQAYYQLFLGGEDVGFDDYLKGIEAVTTENSDLSDRISSQFVSIQNSAEPLKDPLPQQIEDNKEQVQAVFAEMQQLAVLFKTDMASQLGVVITYQDNDGD
ncbi:MAG: imelysin family protein [Marinoscillum sp.]